jgi:hypothetical protein
MRRSLIHLAVLAVCYGRRSAGPVVLFGVVDAAALQKEFYVIESFGTFQAS